MCGVLGYYSDVVAEAAYFAYLGLYAQQHRGQQSAGLAVSDGRRIRIKKGMGLVTQVLTNEALAKMNGRISIGHVRYSAAGEPHIANAQPLLGATRHGQIAIAHSGRLVNSAGLRRELQLNGAVFQSTTDSEIILNLIARQQCDSIEAAVVKAYSRLQGAFAVVLMTNDALIGFRDPSGIQPLCIGKLADTILLASESAAFDTIGAEFMREVRPGELVIIDAQGLRSKVINAQGRPAFCVFEYIYFARPDSYFAGKNVHLVRKQIGRRLAQEANLVADLVIPAPDSGTSAAMGFAEEAGIPFDFGLMKNRYVGRTFIQPTQALRQQGVRIKLNPVRALLAGKRVVLVDDSIVRGTTSAKTVEMVREAGASEVHLAVASPMFLHPCHYGIDIPSTDHLIAPERTKEEIRALLGADSLHYLSLEGLYAAVGAKSDQVCDACFSGRYAAGMYEATQDLDFLEDDND
ncbi:MAG TPA: amidophosphoribosyltransferase [Firmicutes bacterium]|nr:amidophosphoribosyltransferase [Bacillota bacterium]